MPALSIAMESTDSGSDLSSPPSSLLSSPSPPSSPLSSLPSLSPSPPPDDVRTMLYPSRARAAYPSPPASQQTSQSGSPSPDGMDSTTTTSATTTGNTDGPPPKKRRRISKERTTEHLDLRSDTVDPAQQQLLDRLLHVLHKHQKIVFVAGAGISTTAGIPDFRSSQGLFRSLKDEYNLKGSGKHLFDASVYKDDVSTSSFHDMVSSMSRLTKDAKPTAFHNMLATIAQEDRLLRLYSQNVDGIDTALEPLKTCVPLRKDQSGKWPRTVQLHGGLDKMVCSKCQELSDLDPELFTGPVPPLCSRCEEINDIRTNHEGKRSHGIGRLRPRMVLYNEHNPDDEAIGAVTKDDLRKRPDAIIVVGTTLKVPGVRRIVREMCATVRDRRGGVAIWINNDPPPVAKDLEDCWDIIVQGPSDEVAKHAAMRKWNDPVLSDEFSEISDEDAKKAASKTLQVQLSSPPSSCDVEHLEPVRLPSEEHKNNSFRPTLERTPRKPLDVAPVFSPIGSPRHQRVLPSIEKSSGSDETIAFSRSDEIPVMPGFNGLLTPKSQRSTPANNEERPFIPFTAQLKGKGQTKPVGKKGGRKADQAKTSGKKDTKAPKAPKNTQSKKKPAIAKPNKALNFKAKKSPANPSKDLEHEVCGQSKLRHVSNASRSPSPLDTTRPLSPQDPNSSRTKTPPFQPTDLALGPGLPSENRNQFRKRTRMSIDSITN